MTYNFNKHYYDPYDSLDVDWKVKISRGFLSVGDVAALSGFSRQYIHRLVRQGVILPAKSNNLKPIAICWREFLRWYSALCVTPDSPIGVASYSLKELMRITGFGRCWALRFVERYQIPSYYVGVYRRFCKSSFDAAWSRESVLVKDWLTAEELEHTFAVQHSWLLMSVAFGRGVACDDVVYDFCTGLACHIREYT